MTNSFTARIFPLVVAFWVFHGTATGLRAESSAAVGPENLAVLWTSGDPEVAHRVAFLYTLNAKKQNWFEDVTLIVWGPSQRLLAADKEVQAYVKKCGTPVWWWKHASIVRRPAASTKPSGLSGSR